MGAIVILNHMMWRVGVKVTRGVPSLALPILISIFFSYSVIFTDGFPSENLTGLYARILGWFPPPRRSAEMDPTGTRIGAISSTDNHRAIRLSPDIAPRRRRGFCSHTILISEAGETISRYNTPPALLPIANINRFAAFGAILGLPIAYKIPEMPRLRIC